MRRAAQRTRIGTAAATLFAALSNLLPCACGPVSPPRMPGARPETLAVEHGTPTRQFCGQLRPSGRWLACPDGRRFRWRGVTAFMLNELVASGRDADAAAFLGWARHTGFNVVRVLVMLPRGWFEDPDFTPDEGLAALPRTLALARDSDLYVEVTVLANTASLPADADLGGYVERAGRICATAENCALVEVANEYFHQTQREDVRDARVLARWAARVPAGIPTALGAPADAGAVSVAEAPVITIHLDRGPDRWVRARGVRDLEEASARTNRFVIDNEPIGADEREQPGRRDDRPEVFFAQGALSRVFEVGSNFHSEDGLRARVPGPIQQRCAEAFVAGTRVIGDSKVLAFRDAGWPDSPVRAVRIRPPSTSPGAAPGPLSDRPEGAVVAAFAGLTRAVPKRPGPDGVLVLLGLDGEPVIEWRSPWRRSGVIAIWPGVQVWAISRGE